MAHIEAIDMAEADANAEDRPIVAAQQDGGLVERLNYELHCLDKGGRQHAVVAEAATALAEKDARIAELEAELIQSRNFWSDELSAKNAQLTASRAECEGLRVTIRKALKESRKGRPDPDKIYDILRAALSQKENGDA